MHLPAPKQHGKSTPGVTLQIAAFNTQHFPSLQVVGELQLGRVPHRHVPDMHAPPVHAEPSFFIGLEHRPELGSQVPATWHSSEAVQTTGFPPVHTPLWHVSVR